MWKEVDRLEKDIILCIHKQPLSITEIAKKVKRDKSTISSTIKRLEEQEIVKKSHDYSKDARKTEISINHKRIRIEKSHMFYLTYYILICISLIFSGIISSILKNPLFFLGSIIIALPIFLLMLYEVYVKEDKTIVEKNPKLKEKKSKIEADQKIESSFNPQTN